MKTQIEFYDSGTEQNIKMIVSDSGFTGKDLLLVSAEQYVNEIKGTSPVHTDTSLNRSANLVLASVVPLNSITAPIQSNRSENNTSNSTYTGGTDGANTY